MEYVNGLTEETLRGTRQLGELTLALQEDGADPSDATIPNLKLAMQYINNSNIGYEFVTELGTPTGTGTFYKFRITRKASG